VLTVGEVKARYWAEPSQPGLTITECTHVFPESTNANIEPGSDRVCAYVLNLAFDIIIFHQADERCIDVGRHAKIRLY
jgi:hypothetical protein